MSPDNGKAAPGSALIVEDNVIIALEIEALLQDMGIETSFIAGTVEAALMLLDVREIRFAVVDVDLGQETSEEVAQTLSAREVPFIFASGYGDTDPMTERFPNVPTLMKPFTAATLYAALEQVGVH